MLHFLSFHTWAIPWVHSTLIYRVFIIFIQPCFFIYSPMSIGYASLLGPFSHVFALSVQWGRDCDKWHSMNVYWCWHRWNRMSESVLKTSYTCHPVPPSLADGWLEMLYMERANTQCETSALFTLWAPPQLPTPGLFHQSLVSTYFWSHSSGDMGSESPTLSRNR